jgi:DNA-binding NarL/FixJ family response regulator
VPKLRTREPATTLGGRLADRTVRILVVGEHALCREAVAFMLDRQPGMRVVAHVSARDAPAVEEQWDVAMVEPDVPDGDGVVVTIEHLRRRRPDAQILVFTTDPRSLDLARVVAAGASGIVPRTSSLTEVAEALRRVADGETLLDSRQVVEVLRAGREERERVERAREVAGRLTPRERQILQTLADGHDNRAVAELLHIAVETQRTHMVNILSKLDAHSQLQAVLVAARLGIVHLR